MHEYECKEWIHAVPFFAAWVCAKVSFSDATTAELSSTRNNVVADGTRSNNMGRLHRKTEYVHFPFKAQCICVCVFVPLAFRLITYSVEDSTWIFLFSKCVPQDPSWLQLIQLRHSLRYHNDGRSQQLIYWVSSTWRSVTATISIHETVAYYAQ